MVARVIAVSRTLGSGADVISQSVAAELGFRHLDREIIDEAAKIAHSTPELLARTEERKTWIGKVVDRLAQLHDPVTGVNFVRTLAPDSLPREFQEFIISVIYDVAAEGSVVVTGHGASIPLAGTPGLLRVLVTGSPDARAERLSREQSISLDEARKVAKASDEARADYFRRFYGLHREEVKHYDLALNTDVIADDVAAATILVVARSL